MTDTTATLGKLDFGSVLRATLDVLGRNWRGFLLLSIVLVGIPALIQGLGAPDGEAAEDFSPTAEQVILAVLGSLLLIAGSAVQYAALAYWTVADLEGRDLTAGEAIRIGFARFWPMFGLMLLLGLGVALGFLLLIVPGVWLAAAWSVAGVARAVEGPGIRRAFARSVALTRGNRLRILGLVVVLLVSFVGLAVAIGLASWVLGAVLPFSLDLASALGNVAGSAVGTALAGSIYVELRRLHGEGPALPANLSADPIVS